MLRAHVRSVARREWQRATLALSAVTIGGLVVGAIFLLIPRPVRAGLTEQNVPAADLPSPTSSASPAATPGAAGDNGSGATDTSAGEAAGPSPAASPAGDAAAEDGEPDDTGSPPSATPTDVPPPYDVGSVAVAPNVGDQPLTALINAPGATPARVSSIRTTEDARQALAAGNTDDAIRLLGEAVSVDPSNPYAYFFLGRAYLTKKDYAQALAFFSRSEIGLRGDPAWLGEAKSNEGACYEEQSDLPKAAAAYKQALDDEPGNLMARIGYDRTAASIPDTSADNPDADSLGPEPTPDFDEALPPPENPNLDRPAPAEPTPAPAEPPADSN